MTSTRNRNSGEGAGFPGGGSATMRGALLIAVAVLVGVLLLAQGFDTGFLPSTSDDAGEVGTGDDEADDGDDEDDDSTDTTESTPVTHAAADVRVQVLNGGGPSGVAGERTTALQAAGYSTVDAANAEQAVTQTTILYAEDFEADAALVAAAAELPDVTPEPMGDTPPAPAPAGTVDVIIILGPDIPAQ
ncbi:MAG: LytR C-terminal domain-containing protein [Acidimicrobiales bacterium]